jgi:ACS family glucarate transporter-like MFS transporter
MRWLLIFWIFVISAIAYLDRVNVSITGRAIATEFHLDNVQLGWMFSAFMIGYALFQAPAGRLADRIGPRITLTMGVVWWGVFTALITVLPANGSHLLFLLIAVRFALGIGEAVVYPASSCVVSAWIPSTERGVANGFIFSGVGFGAGVTPPLITYIMIHHGWRAAFWVSALLGLAAGAIWFILSRDTPQRHPWVSEHEKEQIRRGLPANSSGERTERLPWRLILSNRDIWAVTFSYFTYGYAAYIFFSWFFIYLNDVRGLNLRQSSYYAMLPFLAMALASPLGGWISDRLTEAYGKRAGRGAIAVVGIGLSAVFIALSTRVESAELASFILAGGAGALYLSQSSFWSVSADIGGRSAGSVSGFMNMGGQLGGALTGSLTPAIATHFGWNASFLVAAALCACGAAAWLIVGTGPQLSAQTSAQPVGSYSPEDQATRNSG